MALCGVITNYLRRLICYMCCISSAVFLLSAHSISLADDYLDALKDEASHLEYLDETRPGNTVSTRDNNVSPEIQKAMSSIESFENYFRQTDSASATIYFRLNTQERLRIYHRFKATRNFDVARKMTIDTFNQKK